MAKKGGLGVRTTTTQNNSSSIKNDQGNNQKSVDKESVEIGAKYAEESHRLDKHIETRAHDATAVSVARIDCDSNPRPIPYGFDTFRSITWPSIDLSIEEVESELRTLLDSGQLPERSSKAYQDDEATLGFLLDIHVLAQSISKRLINPPVLYSYADPDESTRYQLVAGQRRVIAAIYAQIEVIDATLFQTKPTEEELAFITDRENSDRSDLDIAGQLISRRNYLQSRSNLDEISRSEAARLWGESASTARFVLTMIRLPDDQFHELIGHLYANSIEKISPAFNLYKKLFKEHHKKEEQKDPGDPTEQSPTKKTGRKPVKTKYIGGASFNLKEAEKPAIVMTKHLSTYPGLPEDISLLMKEAETPYQVAEAWEKFAEFIELEENSK